MSIAADAPFTIPRPVLPHWAIWAVLPLYAALLALAWWGLIHLVPDTASVQVLGHAFSLDNIHHKILGNAALVLALLPAVRTPQCAVIGWDKSSARALLNPTR